MSRVCTFEKRGENLTKAERIKEIVGVLGPHSVEKVRYTLNIPGSKNGWTSAVELSKTFDDCWDSFFRVSESETRKKLLEKALRLSSSAEESHWVYRNAAETKLRDEAQKKTESFLLEKLDLAVDIESCLEIFDFSPSDEVGKKVIDKVSNMAVRIVDWAKIYKRSPSFFLETECVRKIDSLLA